MLVNCKSCTQALKQVAISLLFLASVSLQLLKLPSFSMPGGASVPRDRYPEMDWQAFDKVATWKIFKKLMETAQPWREGMPLYL